MPIHGCGPLTFSEPTVNSPLDAASKPPIIRSSVDLPQPEGPMIEKNSPPLTSNETLLTATTCSDPLSASPKILLTLRKVKIVIDSSHQGAINRALQIGGLREGVKADRAGVSRLQDV